MLYRPLRELLVLSSMVAILLLHLCSSVALPALEASDVSRYSSNANPNHAHADRILETLRAANYARSQRADAEAAWASDQQELQLLMNEARRRYQLDIKKENSNQQAITAIKENIQQWQSHEKDSFALDAVVMRLALETDVRLDALAKIVPSSVVPVKALRSDGSNRNGGDATYVFSQACSRLQSAKDACSQWHLSISSGAVFGEVSEGPVVYDQLRVAAVAAWWLSRDRTRGGMVQRTNGKNILHPVGAKDLAAIRQAFLVAGGETHSTLIRLPCIPITAVDSMWRQLQVGHDQ